MFDKTNNITPLRPEDEEDREPMQQQRPAEKSTPSQQGRFLSALEKKEEEAKLAKKTKELSAAKEKEKGMFELARTKAVKEQTSDTSGEGEPETQQPSLAPGDKTVAPISIRDKGTGKGEAPGLGGVAAAAHKETLEEASFVRGTSLVGDEQKAPEEISGEGEADMQVDESQITPQPKEIPPESAALRPSILPVEEKPAFKAALGESSARATEKSTKPLEPRKGSGQASRKDEPVATGQPLAQAATPKIVSETTKAESHLETARNDRLALLEVVKQAAEAIATVASKAQTTVVVTLKYPPVFAGSSLVVTESTTAKNEFNIAFSDLSPDARRLIESTANQSSLRQHLVDRGYTLHMITIESTPRPIVTPVAVNETSTEETAEQRYRESGDKGEAGDEALR